MRLMDDQQEHSIGYHSWLLQAIRDNCVDGSDLLEQSKQYKSHKRFEWLLDQLKQRGETEILVGYQTRRRAEYNERSWRLKRQRLASLEKQLASRKQIEGDSYSLFVKRAADKLRKSIERHDRQQQEGMEIADARTEQ